MSMPRAATSVAITTCHFFALKSASVCVRFPWLSSPWKGTAFIPALYSLVATSSAAYLVATNTSTCSQSLVSTNFFNNIVRRFGSTWMARCKIMGSLAAVDSTSIRTGSRNSVSAKACTSLGNVAEKNKLWRFSGSKAKIAASSSVKPPVRTAPPAVGEPPISSSLSASSNTSICTEPNFSALCATKSSKRPGVATTMSAPPRKFIICGLMETPPNSTATLSCMGKCCAKLRIASPVCAASSRVGTRIKADVYLPA